MIVNDRYFGTSPSRQNAVDTFRGQWISSFPNDCGVTSGGVIPLYQDSRIRWLIERLGTSIEHMNLAELGAYEAGHTYMLHQAGAKTITAIEGNSSSYLKCLVVKDVFDLHRATFLCGEIESWVREEHGPYDLIVASGVLYHFSDPLAVLEKLCRITNRLFIWTHYFHRDLMPDGDPRRGPFTGTTRATTCDGYSALYHERSYQGAEGNESFCGGIRRTSVWMEHKDIVGCLGHWGMKVEEFFVEPHHQQGPSSCFYATRPPTSDDRIRSWFRLPTFRGTRRGS